MNKTAFHQGYMQKTAGGFTGVDFGINARALARQTDPNIGNAAQDIRDLARLKLREEPTAATDLLPVAGFGTVAGGLIGASAAVPSSFDAAGFYRGASTHNPRRTNVGKGALIGAGLGSLAFLSTALKDRHNRELAQQVSDTKRAKLEQIVANLRNKRILGNLETELAQ